MTRPPPTAPAPPGGVFSGRDWAVDAAIATVAALVSLPDTVRTAVSVAGWGWPGRAALVLAAALPLAALVIRRRYPISALGIAGTGMLVALLLPDAAGPPAARYGMALPPVLLPASAAYFGVLYSASACAVRPGPRIALIASLAGGVATITRVWSPRLAPGATLSPLAWRLAMIALVTAGIAGAWGLGRLQAARREAAVARERARQLAVRGRVAAAVVEERSRIAGELHDVISHSLAVMVRQAEGGRMVAAQDPARAAVALDQIAVTGRAAMTDMRSLLGVLRDPADPASTVVPGTTDSIDGIVARVRAAGMPARLETTGTPHALPPEVHLAANRVVQEALTNVLRHAGAAAPVLVERSYTPAALGLTVRNSPDPSPDAGATSRTGPGGGRGLAGLRERVEQLGGSFTAGPRPDGGFVVTATLPTPDPGSRP